MHKQEVDMFKFASAVEHDLCSQAFVLVVTELTHEVEIEPSESFSVGIRVESFHLTLEDGYTLIHSE